MNWKLTGDGKTRGLPAGKKMTGDEVLKIKALVKPRKPDLFDSDLSPERFEHYWTKTMLAIDTETRGLVIPRDRLCLIQMCDDEGVVSLVRYHGQPAPLLKRLLESPTTTKLFHYARFDVAVLKHYLQVEVYPIWCTKLASKLVRTYTDRHSLKDLGRELLNLEMDKTDQSSDWARDDLSDSQLEYAANDVRVLIPIFERLKTMLEREGRMDTATRLFNFLPVMAQLDLGGWRDIFEH